MTLSTFKQAVVEAALERTDASMRPQDRIAAAVEMLARTPITENMGAEQRAIVRHARYLVARAHRLARVMERTGWRIVTVPMWKGRILN